MDLWQGSTPVSATQESRFTAHLCCNSGAPAAVLAEAHGDERAHDGRIRLGVLRPGLWLRGCTGGQLCRLLHATLGCLSAPLRRYGPLPELRSCASPTSCNAHVGTADASQNGCKEDRPHLGLRLLARLQASAAQVLQAEVVRHVYQHLQLLRRPILCYVVSGAVADCLSR